MQHKLIKSMFVLLALFLTTSEAQANIGLPMIVVVWPTFWFALIPIVVIESLVMKRILTSTSSRYLLFTATSSNLISTLVGIPLAWLGMLLIQLTVPGGAGTFPDLNPYAQAILSVTLQAPWLLPYAHQYFWMIPTAFTVLMIPLFFMSYIIEAWVSLKMLTRQSGESSEIVKRAVWNANLFSYLFLFISVIILSLIPPASLENFLNAAPATLKNVMILMSYVFIAIGFWVGENINIMSTLSLLMGIAALILFAYKRYRK